MTVSSKSRQDKEQEEGRSERDGGKREQKLSEVNTWAVSRGQNELIGELKMASYVIIAGVVKNYTKF